MRSNRGKAEKAWRQTKRRGERLEEKVTGRPESLRAALVFRYSLFVTDYHSQCVQLTALGRRRRRRRRRTPESRWWALQLVNRWSRSKHDLSPRESPRRRQQPLGPTEREDTSRRRSAFSLRWQPHPPCVYVTISRRSIWTPLLRSLLPLVRGAMCCSGLADCAGGTRWGGRRCDTQTQTSPFFFFSSSCLPRCFWGNLSYVLSEHLPIAKMTHFSSLLSFHILLLAPRLLSSPPSLNMSTDFCHDFLHNKRVSFHQCDPRSTC